MFRRSSYRVFRTACITTVALAVMAPLASCDANGGAEADGAYYAGKNITIVVPFSAGGGNDIQSRYMAEQLKETMPGSPSFQVVNEGGAGSVIGTNAFARKQDTSGETLLYTSASTNLNLLLKAKGVEYSYKDFAPIAVVPSGSVTYIAPRTGVKTIADLKDMDEPLVFGAQSTHGADALNLLAYKLLGLNIEVVVGYEGSGDVEIAFQQGEVDIDKQTTSSYIQNVVPLVEAGEAIPLYTLGQLDSNGDVVRDPVFPDLPHVGEVYEQLHGVKPSGPEWTAYKAMLAAGASYAKILWAYNGTPPEAIQALQAGLSDMIATQSETDEYQQTIGSYEVLLDSDAESAIKNGLLETSPETQQWILDWLEESFGSDS